jgi:hypothetical protein
MKYVVTVTPLHSDKSHYFHTLVDKRALFKCSAAFQQQLISSARTVTALDKFQYSALIVPKKTNNLHKNPLNQLSEGV